MDYQNFFNRDFFPTPVEVIDQMMQFSEVQGNLHDWFLLIKIFSNMERKKYVLFANGTECMIWQSNNCERCIKAVFYNEKRGTFPSYRCAIQREIELASVTDGCGTQRAYDATQKSICPFLQTERKPKKPAEDKNQLNLF